MNDMPDDMLLTQPDEQVSAIRDPIFHDIIAAHRAADVFNRERSRAGWWIGGIGAGIGVLGVLAATVMAVHFEPKRIYTEIDDASGVIRQSYGAKDAPSHFNDRVVRHYIAEYIGLREGFTWQVDSQTDHRVKLMSSPNEQRAYAHAKAAEDVAARYGMNGYSRVSHFTSFTERAKGKDGTYEYDVQFVLSELDAGANQIRTTHKTARILFQMHPEIEMSDQDRLDNEAGLFVIAYTSSAD